MNIFENIREIIIEVAISIGVEDKNILNKITAEPPKDELHGDIATNIALLSAKILKKKPKEIASEFIEMNYSDENKLFLSPFSFTGRIRRKEYILTLILCMAYLFLIVFANNVFRLDSIFGIICLPAVWFRIVQGAKRAHDLGNSGWFQIIPLYGFWMLFVDGEKFANKYGENPKGISLIFKD